MKMKTKLFIGATFSVFLFSLPAHNVSTQIVSHKERAVVSFRSNAMPGTGVLR